MLWRRLDLPGHEIATLDALDDGWELSGTAIFSSQRGPSRLNYVVLCDSTWRTSWAQVRGSVGDRGVDLTVSVNAQRSWYVNKAECPPVKGCIDIDLGFSPATNLLPIRRLSLAVGDQAEVAAAWLPFPSLEFELLSQVYRRQGENTYHYESGGGAFVTTLEVNAAGFVANYPGLWQAES
jgi:uncharacterized protein